MTENPSIETASKSTLPTLDSLMKLSPDDRLRVLRGERIPEQPEPRHARDTEDPLVEIVEARGNSPHATLDFYLKIPAEKRLLCLAGKIPLSVAAFTHLQEKLGQNFPSDTSLEELATGFDSAIKARGYNPNDPSLPLIDLAKGYLDMQTIGSKAEKIGRTPPQPSPPQPSAEVTISTPAAPTTIEAPTAPKEPIVTPLSPAVTENPTITSQPIETIAPPLQATIEERRQALEAPRQLIETPTAPPIQIDESLSLQGQTVQRQIEQRLNMLSEDRVEILKEGSEDRKVVEDLLKTLPADEQTKLRANYGISDIHTHSNTNKPNILNRIIRRRTFVAAGAALGVVGGIKANQLLNQVANAAEAAPQYSSDILSSANQEIAPPSPAPTTTIESVAPVEVIPVATASPTAVPEVNPPKTEPPPKPVEKEIIGDKNIAEFLLGKLPEMFREKRMERFQNDPQFIDAMVGDAKTDEDKQKIIKEILMSNRINFAVLTIDETRQRPHEYSGMGAGRSDTMMVVSFDPRTLKTIVLSIPRDLYSPTVREDFDSQDTPAKINHLTLIPWKHVEEAKSSNIPFTKDMEEKEIADNHQKVKRELEQVTGLPIDAVMKVNIDATQGYTDADGMQRPGFLDTLVPNDGLPIRVQTSNEKELYDPTFPVEGYGTKVLRYAKGAIIRLKGKDLAEYARTRADSAADRDARQRQVAIEVGKYLLGKLKDDVTSGTVSTLDSTIEIMGWHKNDGNFFSDIKAVAIAETMRKSIKDILANKAALAKLILNSAGVLKDIALDRSKIIVQEGFSRENLLVNASEGEGGLGNTYALLKPAGQDIGKVEKNGNGNYLSYYESIRKHMRNIYFNQSNQ